MPNDENKPLYKALSAYVTPLSLRNEKDDTADYAYIRVLAAASILNVILQDRVEHAMGISGKIRYRVFGIKNDNDFNYLIRAFVGGKTIKDLRALKFEMRRPSVSLELRMIYDVLQQVNVAMRTVEFPTLSNGEPDEDHRLTVEECDVFVEVYNSILEIYLTYRYVEHSRNYVSRTARMSEYQTKVLGSLTEDQEKLYQFLGYWQTKMPTSVRLTQGSFAPFGISSSSAVVLEEQLRYLGVVERASNAYWSAMKLPYYSAGAVPFEFPEGLEKLPAIEADILMYTRAFTSRGSVTQQMLNKNFPDLPLKDLAGYMQDLVRRNLLKKDGRGYKLVDPKISSVEIFQNVAEVQAPVPAEPSLPLEEQVLLQVEKTKALQDELDSVREARKATELAHQRMREAFKEQEAELNAVIAQERKLQKQIASASDALANNPLAERIYRQLKPTFEK